MRTIRKTITRRLLAIFTAFASLGSIAALGGLPTAVSADGETNLVANLPYTIHMGADITHSYGKWLDQSPDSETAPEAGKLTDGKRASGKSFSDPAWHKFYRGLSRTVEFALPEEKAVTGFSISALQDNAAGLGLSPWYELSVSENGTDYMVVSRYDTSSLLNRSGTNYHTIVAKDLCRVRANYVRLTFRTSVNVFVDEIEIYGTDPDGTETPFVKTEEPTYANAFDPGIEGCREIVLLYCGYPGYGTNEGVKNSEDDVQNTEEEMLYYFGYIGTDGSIQDTFFDSFMFSALGGSCPSGGNLTQSQKKQNFKGDWEYYLDSIFDETYNCGAIERAVERVQEATGAQDLVVNMIINMPYPTLGTKPFGDLDGDGADEYCRNEDEQFAIYKWFFDQVDVYLAKRQYKHIRLGGYYWEQETLPLDAGDVPLMHRVIAESHARGINFFWIPLLFGDGFDQAYEHGFDCAMMQPNFSFLPYAEEPCITEIVSEIKKYGLGIEMEIHWNYAIDDELLSRYYSYLNAGYALGYIQDVAHSYYQNASPGTFYHCAKSSDAKLRGIYDDTYAFAKGTYQPRKVALRAREMNATAGETVHGFVGTERGCYLPTLGDYRLILLDGPAHGTVELRDSGVYEYTPDADFSGVDTFTVQMVATYASSEPLTVTVNVNRAEEPEHSESAESSEPVATPTPASKTNMGLLVGGIAAAALAIGGAVGALIRKKRKKS